MNEQKEQKKAIKVLNLTVFLINFSIKMISKRNSLPLKTGFFHKLCTECTMPLLAPSKATFYWNTKLIFNLFLATS